LVIAIYYFGFAKKARGKGGKEGMGEEGLLIVD